MLKGFMYAGIISATFIVSMTAVSAQTPPASKEAGVGLAVLGSNSDPIKITSDQLDVFDKENKAIFTGNVVAVQGDSTLKCKNLEVYYAPKTEGNQEDAPSKKTTPGLPSDGSSITKIECLGPVTIVSKTQVATGDHATFERTQNKVFMKGNVVLNDGPNVTKGQSLVYDVKTGIAKVQGGRVRTLIITESTPVPGQ